MTCNPNLKLERLIDHPVYESIRFKINTKNGLLIENKLWIQSLVLDDILTSLNDILYSI